jgi:hypothetical protein
MPGGDPYFHTPDSGLPYLYPPVFIFVGTTLAHVLTGHLGWRLYVALQIISALRVAGVLYRHYLRDASVSLATFYVPFFAARGFRSRSDAIIAVLRTLRTRGAKRLLPSWYALVLVGYSLPYHASNTTTCVLSSRGFLHLHRHRGPKVPDSSLFCPVNSIAQFLSANSRQGYEWGRGSVGDSPLLGMECLPPAHHHGLSDLPPNSARLILRIYLVAGAVAKVGNAAGVFQVGDAHVFSIAQSLA